jgi:hypothetical protein
MIPVTIEVYKESVLENVCSLSQGQLEGFEFVNRQGTNAILVLLDHFAVSISFNTPLNSSRFRIIR